MKRSLHARLARLSLKNNRSITLPYILTAASMVMLFYIVLFLARDGEIRQLRGGEMLQLWMHFGVGVIGLFSVLFLFYTNSFIMKRRKRELGLYNILGMDKGNIARVLARETLYIAVISILAGLASGILLSKLAQLAMIRIMGEEAPLSFPIRWDAALLAAAVYAAIFLGVYLRSLIGLHRVNPIELLHASSAGEREPRGNFLLAALGILTLGGGYAIAILVKDVFSAVSLFFVAVILVIIGTYCCFIAGSVTVLRILKKNRRYYYKPRHFVTVSGMIYRMRRSGAGLASITILATMVLVMLSSTSCLYIGSEEILRGMYPRMFSYAVRTEDAQSAELESTVNEVLAAHGMQPENALCYRYANVFGYGKDGWLKNPDTAQGADSVSPVTAFLIPLEDYNRCTGENRTLGSGEVLACMKKGKLSGDTVRLWDGPVFRVREQIDFTLETGEQAALDACPVLYLVLPDAEAIRAACGEAAEGSSAPALYTRYAFDVDADEDAQRSLSGDILDRLGGANQYLRMTVECMGRSDYYSMYAGLFCLAILLALAFLLAAVLIMYYKQITEGYEDQSRFDVMQKVGMTDVEIRSTVNRQVLTVFFLPLGAATVHMAFAFPLVRRLLTLFSLTNTTLFLIVTAVAIGVFALFYLIVYRVTSRAYYGIVRGAQKAA